MDHQDPSHAIFSTSSPDLYEALSIKSTATETEIKTAYRKLALRYHPDKLPLNSNSDLILKSKQKFEQISFSYKILSDSKSRERYDKTGKTDEHFLEDKDVGEWLNYFKELWSGIVDAKTIKEFTDKYQGSEEELNDIHELYHTYDGDLNQILPHVLCSTNSDEPRIINLIENSIKNDLLPKKSNWDKSKSDKKAANKRSRIAKKESLEAEAYAKELGIHDQLFKNRDQEDDKVKKENRSIDNDEETLKALIQSRSKDRHESLISKLEAKAKIENQKRKSKNNNNKDNQTHKKRKSDKIDEDEDENDEEVPNEEEFQKIQDQLKSNHQSSTSQQTINPTSSKNKTTRSRKKSKH